MADCIPLDSSVLPEFNNVYGSLETRRTKDWIASRFKKAGWSIRHCTWTDYEVESDYAELVIKGDTTILLNGAVADFDSNLPAIASVLEGNNIGYTIEHYDEAGNLLREVKNMPDAPAN